MNDDKERQQVEAAMRYADSVHRKANRAQRRSKLVEGKYTMAEAHMKWSFPRGAQCLGCGSRKPCTTIRSFAPLADIDPAVIGELLATKGEAALKQLFITHKDGTPYLRVSTVFACKACTPEAEKQAARCPSYVIVDIDKGPDLKVDAMLLGWRASAPH